MSLFDRAMNGTWTQEEYEVFTYTWYMYKGPYDRRRLKKLYNKNWYSRVTWVRNNRSSISKYARPGRRDNG